MSLFFCLSEITVRPNFKKLVSFKIPYRYYGGGICNSLIFNRLLHHQNNISSKSSLFTATPPLNRHSSNANQNINTNKNVNFYPKSLSSLLLPQFSNSHCQIVRFKNLYSKFSDGSPKKTSWGHKGYAIFLGVGLFTVLFTNLWIVSENNTKAASSVTAENSKKDSESAPPCAEEKPKKKRVGFRERKIIEYENRIRDYSTPDKIFRYFATKKVQSDKADVIVYMTPDDFVRSITPSAKQDEGLGLDHFDKFDPKVDQVDSKLGRDSIFWKFGQNGLISFSDYMFLLVLLSTPPRAIEIAFKMFDFNGDGNLDFDEFDRVTEVLRSHSFVGMRHRDHAVTGNILKSMSSGLAIYFFGDNLTNKLTVDKFLSFQKQLMTEILQLEFNRYEPNNGRISEKDFADSIIIYAGHNFNKKSKMLKKVKRTFTDGVGITFQEYFDFFKVLKHINDIDVALVFYNVAGASIDKQTLKHVAKTVAHVDLSDHLIDVVFILFDENDDGELSHREFISVMKRRLMRGLEKPRDTGLVRIFSAMWKCAKLQASILEG